MRRIVGVLLFVIATSLGFIGATTVAPPHNTDLIVAPTSIYEFFADHTGVQCEMGRADTSWVKRDYAYCQSVSANISVSFKRGGVPKICDDHVSCLGNPGLNTPHLHAGQAVRSGDIVCAITRDAVTCHDSGANGFMMTRDRIAPLVHD